MTVPQLYAHQVAMLRQLANVQNYLLSWQMGCGKSVTAIAHGAALPDAGARLYIGPASCRLQTTREIRRFHPGANVQVLSGRRARLEPGVNWYVTNYETLLFDEVFDQLRAQAWPLVVLDESHLLKSMSAKRTGRTLSRNGLATKADRVLAASGTPVVNNPLDLFPLMARLFPESLRLDGRLMGAAEFTRRFCAVRTLNIRGRPVERIVGGQNLPDLRARLAPYMSRVRLDQVIDLPPLTVTGYALDVDPEAVAAAEAALPEGLLEALRQADDEELPKLLQDEAIATARRVIGLLKARTTAVRIMECLEAGEDRIIAFHHHRGVGDLLRSHLHEYPVALIRGDTPADARSRAIDQFTAGDVRVLLLQTAVGGLGLNLQSCRRAIIVEPSWTSAEMQQAIGRIHRSGQTRHCFVEHHFVENSLDEIISGFAQRKARLAHDLIEEPIKETA